MRARPDIIDLKYAGEYAPHVVTETAIRIAKLQKDGADRATITSLLSSWRRLLDVTSYQNFTDAFLDEMGRT